ncbi:HAMP domain-containing sensor histidine kinase [Cohnella sp. LGH]|uniref:sensor histidine kinase n=1 Tax=Cohnella sp. LGH TaxID=1619153 RepID=UPI001FFDFE00|nr:HAMP domain-containing sensor histidine kinase [Cohnella sp. LGH]
MWKDALLQILIVFLPVFMFMVWYDKPDRTGYSHIFIGLCCGLAMLLNMSFTTVNPYGVSLDLRHVPLLIGSIYGGIPIGLGLLVVYAAKRLGEIAFQWEYFVLIGFLAVYGTMLFTKKFDYGSRSRKGKLRFALYSCLFLALLQAGSYFASAQGSMSDKLSAVTGAPLIFVSAFIVATLLCVHYIELTIERFQLKLQLRDMSLRYDREIHGLKDEVDRMERLSLVGQMAASITHEIRNPLAVIRGFIQLLNERSPAEQKTYFHIVLEELDRTNLIINDFLSLAQNRTAEKELFNLNDLLSDLLPLIWADANMRGQIIDLHTDASLEPILMNSKEIKQLVLNLSRNGMEAMNDKGALKIETTNLPDSVQLRVSDTGVGIPAEKLKLLFEPFYTTKTNGTGLGLVLCMSIVERHDGKIQVESTVGQGTTFIVSFSKQSASRDSRQAAEQAG